MLTDAGSTRTGDPRGSVRGRGAPAGGPPPGSRGRCLIRCMRLIRPPGCRLNDPGKLTCEALQQTAGANRFSPTCSSPWPPPLLSLVVRPRRARAGFAVAVPQSHSEGVIMRLLTVIALAALVAGAAARADDKPEDR